MWCRGQSWSEGRAAPQSLRATRSQPESIRICAKKTFSPQKSWLSLLFLALAEPSLRANWVIRLTLNRLDTELCGKMWKNNCKKKSKRRKIMSEKKMKINWHQNLKERIEMEIRAKLNNK